MDIIKSASTFKSELQNFAATMSGADLVWDILFPYEPKNWHHLRVVRYLDTFYFTVINGKFDTLALNAEGEITYHQDGSAFSYASQMRGQPEVIWGTLISGALSWMKVVKRDWIKANNRVQVEYPVRDRYGFLPHAIIRDSLPDIYRLDMDLGIDKTRAFIRIVEEGFFNKRENTEVHSLTANEYFKYCQIAYVAVMGGDENFDATLSGRQMYDRYADGRHEGLTEIDAESAKEFADWIDGTHPKRSGGGHPWEIMRGGNTTHINLGVLHPSYYLKEDFKVELRAESSGRMAETIRMFLAIQEKGLPVSISDPEGIRKRLLAHDNIGLIPSYNSLHRANQHFPKDKDVFDVMYYDDLGRYKRRAASFITWEPLPILKPLDYK